MNQTMIKTPSGTYNRPHAIHFRPIRCRGAGFKTGLPEIVSKKPLKYRVVLTYFTKMEIPPSNEVMFLLYKEGEPNPIPEGVCYEAKQEIPIHDQKTVLQEFFIKFNACSFRTGQCRFIMTINIGGIGEASVIFQSESLKIVARKGNQEKRYWESLCQFPKSLAQVFYENSRRRKRKLRRIEHKLQLQREREEEEARQKIMDGELDNASKSNFMKGMPMNLQPPSHATSSSSIPTHRRQQQQYHPANQHHNNTMDFSIPDPPKMKKPIPIFNMLPEPFPNFLNDMGKDKRSTTSFDTNSIINSNIFEQATPSMDPSLSVSETEDCSFEDLLGSDIFGNGNHESNERDDDDDDDNMMEDIHDNEPHMPKFLDFNPDLEFLDSMMMDEKVDQMMSAPSSSSNDMSSLNMDFAPSHDQSKPESQPPHGGFGPNQGLALYPQWFKLPQ